MEPTNDLDRLALKHGTDKFGIHNYTPKYNAYFSSMRDKAIQLLEIGIGGYSSSEGGASLRMWKEYFPAAGIYGLDFFDKTHLAEDRIDIIQGSQVDPHVISTLLKRTPGGLFDIVIDDASHRGEHIVTTFLMLFPYVSVGGWYVVEDTETSYWPDYGGAQSGSGRLTTMSFFKQLTDNINWSDRSRHQPDYSPNPLDVSVFSIHFYKNLIFIGRGEPV